MSKLLKTLTVAGVLAAPLAATAAPAAAPRAPTLTDVLKASGITASGYVDFGVSKNDQKYNAGSFTYGGSNDQSFTLNQVGLSFASTPGEGFGAVLDLLGGRDAQTVPSDAGSDIVFKQGYVQYATGNMTLMGGRFVTLAGSEVIASTGNSNATRSLLFAYQPLTHTGVRGAFKLGDALTLTAGLNNSYLGNTVDNNLQKTGELSVAFVAGPASAAVTVLKGTESNAGATTQSPMLVDVVAGMGLGKLSLGLNVDHLDYDDATPGNSDTTDGAALYVNAGLTDALRAGLRVEHVETKFVGGGTKRKQDEITATIGVAAAANFDLVTDLRYDKDNTGGGVAGAGLFNGEDTMITATIKGIYKF